MTEAAPSHPSRVRRLLSLAVILLAGPVAVFGGVLYLREEVLDSQAFAARAANVISEPTMSRVVAREIVVQVVEPAQPDLIAARPLIEDGLTQVIRADAFRPVARLAAEHGHRLLFEQGSNAVFDIADAGAVVSSALRTLAPQIADKLPTHAEAVLLTIRRAGSEKLIYLTLTREVITVASVASKLLRDGIGYLRIKTFQTGTHAEFLDHYAKLRQQNGGDLAGVVLDMRNNPGGLVNEASAIADEFLAEGVIYTTRRRGKIVDEVRADNGGAVRRGPLAVLVNEFSASAAELVAGSKTTTARPSSERRLSARVRFRPSSTCRMEPGFGSPRCATTRRAGARSKNKASLRTCSSQEPPPRKPSAWSGRRT